MPIVAEPEVPFIRTEFTFVIPAVLLYAFFKTEWSPDVQAYAEWDTFTFETDPSVAAALTLLGHQ